MPNLIFAFFLISSIAMQGQKTMGNIIKEHPFESLDATSKTLTEIIKLNAGKVIYIDFWASWCGPCKKEMPASMRLSQKMQGEAIVFVYISIDDNNSVWKKALDKMQLTDSGQHYRRARSKMIDFLKYFYIYSIPHYMIINKSGEMHNRDALPPSDPKLSRQLAKLLKQ